MKFLRFFLTLLIGTLLFSSCQKELSLEAGTATGTLKSDGTGDCLPILINGTYQKDTLLKAANYIDVQIEVVQTGNYNIYTDTLNGYSFNAIGQVADAGLQTIRLQATGRPISPGVDVFTVKFSGTTCQVNIIVTGTGGGGGGGTGAYTFGGSPGTCSGAVLSGTYTAGTAMDPTNTATINVNVTTIGTYTLTSSTANGVTFAGSGTFATTGPTSIVLTASGTPTAATTSNYTLTSGASTCTFSVVYSPGAGPTGYTLNCTTPVLAGTYRADLPMTSSNTMTIGVNVTTGGAYNITSTCVNGVTFAGSGTLPATPASQTVTLTATGTPAMAGTFSYPLTGGSSTCSVPVTFAASTATDFIKATIDGTPFTFNDVPDAIYDLTTVPGFNILDINGTSSACTAPTMRLIIARSTPGIVPPGTYTVNATSYIVYGDYVDPVGADYFDQTDGTPHPAPALTIVITSSSLTRISGTFSGILKLGGTGPAIRTITAGSFSVPVH